MVRQYKHHKSNTNLLAGSIHNLILNLCTTGKLLHPFNIRLINEWRRKPTPRALEPAGCERNVMSDHDLHSWLLPHFEQHAQTSAGATRHWIVYIDDRPAGLVPGFQQVFSITEASIACWRKAHPSEQYRQMRLQLPTEGTVAGVTPVWMRQPVCEWLTWWTGGRSDVVYVDTDACFSTATHPHHLVEVGEQIQRSSIYCIQMMECHGPLNAGIFYLMAPWRQTNLVLASGTQIHWRDTASPHEQGTVADWHRWRRDVWTSSVQAVGLSAVPPFLTGLASGHVDPLEYYGRMTTECYLMARPCQTW
jgi:hypothetical protein